jgi:hypothetical protein
LTGVREHMARVGISNARDSFQRGDFFTGVCQAREGFRCSTGPAVLRFLDAGIMQFWDKYVTNATAAVQAYASRVAAGGDPAALAKARGIRRQMAQQILEFTPEWASLVWEHFRTLGAHVVQSGLLDEAWLEDEAKFAGELMTQLADPSKVQEPSSKWCQHLNAALFYCQPQELAVPVTNVPEWLLGDFLQAMFRVPLRWRNTSAPAAMQTALLRLEADVAALGPGAAPIWQQVRQFVAQRMAALRTTAPR